MLFLGKLEKIMFNKIVDIEKEISLKTIAVIPLKENENIELTTNENEKSPTLKAFKALIKNIQFLCVNNVNDKKVMLVTSAREEEGKSYVAANLAVNFASIGKKVLVIDADMTYGRQDKIFNVPNNLGLSNYLSNLDSNGVEINEFLNKFINETAIKNVNLITSGTVPPNPAELLALPKLQEVIKDAKVFFDVIIIDAGQVLEKTEALILARSVNSTILVASSKETKIEDLNKAKKDIQNVGGKIIGVVLNKVKLKKKRKTKKQFKEEFNRFKINIKERINSTIENIKKKIQETNKKLLEAPRKEVVSDNKEEINEVVISNVDIKKDEKLIEDVIDEKNLENEETVKKENKNFKINLLERFKNRKQNQTNRIEIEEQQDIVEKNKEDIVENQLSMFQEIPIEEFNQEENPKEIKSQRKSRLRILRKLRKKLNEKKSNKEKESSEKKETLKENTVKFFGNVKNTFINKIDNIKNKKVELEEENRENEVIEEIIPEIDSESEIEIEDVKQEDIIQEQELANNIDDEKRVLVVVDAEKGYCRIFSKEYFTEKLIRGIDKSDNNSRAHYSSKELKLKREFFVDEFQLTIAQAERIDPVIFSALTDYDRYLWEARNIRSNKAENYAICMAKDFEIQSDEDEKEHLVRCQRQRKIELENYDLEIVYKLDNLWNTNKIRISDKIQLNKFAKIYEIEDAMRNETEINKFEKSKRFYTDIIEGAEKRLENANEAERLEKETQRLAIEEDKKIKQEELKLEQQQIEIEKRAAQERIKIEQENVKAKKKADQEKIKEEKRKEKEIERIEKIEENIRKKKEKQKKKEESKIQKELEKAKLREEAKIEEELLVDNLYPKTKHNKNL